MHATKVLQKVLGPVIARLDRRNARNLLLAVESPIRGRPALRGLPLAQDGPARTRTLVARRLDIARRPLGGRDRRALRSAHARIELLLLVHALATFAAWLEGLAVATAFAVAHPASPPRRTRHSAGWLGWESLRRHGTHLSLSPPEALARLRDMLAQAA
jgi:hypothetical protein